MDMVLKLDDDVKIYFEDIKKNASKIDIKTIEDNLEEITKYIQQAEKLGQKALVRELKNITTLFVYEKRLLNYDIDTYVNMKDIVRFIEQIKGHVIKFCELEYFPRVIPNDVADHITKVKENKIFDEYYVLFTDYTDSELLNTKEAEKRKINKDPIIFGRFNIYPNRYYVIDSWIDEYCDIDFDMFVRTLKNVDPKYQPEKILEDNNVYINRLVKSIEKEKEKENSKEANKKTIANLIKGLFRK